MWDERYDRDVLAGLQSRRGPVERTKVTAHKGLVVEHTQSQWCGAIVALRQGFVELEDYSGRVRSFAIGDAFLIDGEPVRLAPPSAPRTRARTASGSFAAPVTRAKVARPSRLFVEGVHDAELVEQVWGADLRHEGVVVELLDGADQLERVLDEFAPTAAQRAGVLLDHLVPGSKESRIASDILQKPYAQFVRITGHPFVDIWQAVKPARLGLTAWPSIQRGEDWKTGVVRALGWPHADYSDIADAWQRILAKVRGYGDLEPALLARVEELIDFVTTGHHGGA